MITHSTGVPPRSVGHVSIDILKEKLFAKRRFTESDCWEWTGCLVNDNKRPRDLRYGQIRVGKKRFLVHRLAYVIFRGQISRGLFVCHKCDNGPCFNPEHLFVGTQADNVQDSIKKGRFTQKTTRYPLQDLSVNEWMHLPGETIHRVSQAVHYFNKQGMSFTCRSVADGVRVWRIA